MSVPSETIRPGSGLNPIPIPAAAPFPNIRNAIHVENTNGPVRHVAVGNFGFSRHNLRTNRRGRGRHGRWGWNRRRRRGWYWRGWYWRGRCRRGRCRWGRCRRRRCRRRRCRRGGAGGDFNQQQLSLGGNDFEFANIRQTRRFVGVSRTYAIHPFTRVGQNAPILTQGNVDGGATGAPARTTQANTTQAGGVTGFNAFNSPFGQFAQFGRGGFGGLGGFGAQQQAPVRSSLTFNPPPPPPGLAPAGQSVNSPISSPTLGARVRSIPGLANAEVNVSLLNRTAIVSGLVTSEEEKERIGRVLKLEPGVSEIDNRLQVQR
jgi:hypothetical protein